MTDGDHVGLRKRLDRLEGQLRDKEAEAKYYQQIAEETGKRRLREIDQLTKLICEQKQAHEKNDRLEARLKQVQKMETIGTMAAGVAHDLNNVLAGIVGLPDLLLLQLPEDSPLRAPISAIRTSGKKATAIVQDLLTLARKGTVAHEITNLNDIVSEYLRSPEYEKLLSFHPAIEVKTELAQDLMSILGSPVHLSKVVMNLVSNAAEAIVDGGQIVISTRNSGEEQSEDGGGNRMDGNHVILSVSDTGMGIAPEEQERIFDPFYTKKQAGRSGTGLGMTVVWGSVQDHQGTIEVQSAPEKGTTFTLCFPATILKKAITEKPFPIETLMGTGESILVVDDVAEQREIATSLLRRLNYSVASVLSGESALEYLMAHRADLVILDMIMDPGIDGLETYKRIIKLNPRQKTIIASGYSETGRVREAQSLGVGRYLQKPYTLEQIGKAVKEELAA